MMSAQSVLNEENSLFSLLIDGEPICIGAVHVRAEDLAILRSIFSMVDLDGGATISGYELHWMMKVLKKDAYSEEECRSVMGTSNPYVALNFEEFVRILTTVNWGFPLTEVHQRLAKAFEVRHKFSKRLEALSPPQSSAGSSYPTEWNTAASPVYEVVVRRLVKRESTERQYLIDEEIHNRTAVMHQLESSYQVMSVRTKLELELRRERIKSRLSQIRKHNNHPSESKVPLPFGSQENREDFERAMKCEADQRNRLSILQKTNETNVQLVAVLDELRKASLGKVRAWIGADTEAVIQASHRRAVVVDRQLDELEHCIVAIGRQLFQSSIMDSTTDHREVMREFYRNLELSYMATAAENEWTLIEENLMSTETSRGGFDVDCVSLSSSDSDQHPSFRKNIVKKKSCLKEIREKSDFTWLLLPHETVHAVSHRSTHTKASAKVSMLSNTASDSNSIIGSVTALEEEEYLLCHSDPSSFQILGDEELNEEFHTIMKEIDDVIHMLYRYAASDPSKGLTYADYRNFVRVCRIKLPVSVECLTSVWNHIFRPDPTYCDYLKLQISKHLSYATVVHPSFDEETHIASSAPRTGSVRPYQLGSTHQTPCRALSFDGREFTDASKTKELCDSHNVFPQYMHFEHFRGALLIHACERYIRCPGVNPAWKLRVYVYQYIRVQLPKLESAFLHILTRRSAQTSAKPYVTHGAEKLWSEFHNRNLKEGTGDVVKTDGDEAIVSSSTLHHPVTTTKVLRNTSSECKLISSSENALCRPPLGSRPPRCSIYGVLNNTYDVLVSNAKSLARLFVEQMHQNSLKPRIDPVVKLQNQNFVMNELDRPTYDLHVLALRTALNSQLLATALGYNDITDMHGEESVPPLNLPIRPHSVDMSQRDSISQPSLNMHEGTVSTSAARSCGMETIGQRARSDLRVRENRNDSSDVDPEGKAHMFTHGYMLYVSPNLPCSPSSSSATPVLPPAMSKCITKAPLHVRMRQLLACIPVRALRRECSLGAFVEVCRYRHPELDRKWLTLCAVSVITHVIQENFTLLTGTHQIRHSDVDEERQRQILTYLISNTTDLDCSVEDLVTTCRTETTTLVLKDLDQLPLPFIMVLMILIHIGNLYGTSTFAASIQCLTTLHRRHYTATSVDSINETHKGENNGLDLNEDVLSPEYTTRLADFFQALLMETKEFQFWHI